MLKAGVALLAFFDARPEAWGAMAGGFVALWGILVVAILLFSIYCWWRVAEKCGYPGPYSLLLLIPIVNLVVQLIWVFSEWPIETEVKRLRGASLQQR
ncbi:MAG TPA: hypothetical protein VEJ41_08425 [Candidatus Acidoferrales bacterium]|nr:hypothetical protein [Candidatus Acidoferrales bacterium]